MPSWYSHVLRQSGVWLDVTYGQLVHGSSTAKFFPRGWGDISRLDTAQFSRIVCAIQQQPQDHMTVRWLSQRQRRLANALPYEEVEGQLRYLGPGIGGYIHDVPPSCETGRVRGPSAAGMCAHCRL